ncbi:hypothetical protein VNO77_17477 [Canavalia gladiata]|uniref:Uncharacterized protein n=1 Tax=Canavalia gladiata TaxID=3824 RepID=A0AAN9LMH1_CANGL
MEGGGSYSDTEIFSNSFHKEDDEEALKWASIQKLPTIARLRKGLFTTTEGEANEIDIHKLGMQERRALLQRLVRTAEEDNEGFLLKLKDRIDRVGIDLPTIEVRFEHLNIEAEAHVGTRALPTFTNFMVNIVEGLLNSLHIIPSRRQHINILRDVSGIIKPGRMTLLLGPPSSGKTTLLLALAAKLNPNLKFSGKVTYNGHGMDEFVPQRTAAYVNQNDLHVGELTVRETLAFSARVQGVGTRYDLLAELSRREKEANIKPDPDIDVYMKAVATEGQKANLITDYVLRILGLEVCADTIVGNAMLRGISGGQRKRVTTGEMLLAVLAIMTMTIFFQTEMHRDSVTHGGMYVGAIFYGLLVIMFNGIAELSMVVSRLPVFYRQRDYLFFPSWVYALPAWILKIPMTFVEVGVWVFLTYYVIGFDPCVGRLFRQYLILVLANQMTSALFRFIAAVGRDLIVALTLGSFVLTILFAMGGFLLSKDNIKKWWLWGFWISPMMYGQNAMVNNEFLGKRWRHVLTNSSEPLGVEVLKSRGFFTQSYWYWIGVGALIGYTLLFNFGYVLSLTYLNPIRKHQAVILDEPQSNEQNGGSKREANVLKHVKYSFSQHSNRVRNGENIRRNSSPRSLSTRQETVTSETNHNRKRGMVLPFDPHSISFDEVTYAVDMPQMFIEEVMEMVELKPLRRAIVGFPGVNGLSTEQRKRSSSPCKSFTHVHTFILKGIQGVNKIKDGYNPATWMLEVTTSAKEMELGIDFAELYKNSELYRRNKALIEELSCPVPGSKDLYFPSQYSTSLFTQCMACLWKQHWSYWRNPLYTALRFLYSTAVAVLLGSIEKQQDLFNAMGSMYAAVLLIGIKNANAVVIELPYVLVQAVVYGIIIYAMIGFEWTVTKVFWYLFFLYFTFISFTYYGMLSVAMTPNQHISAIISSAFCAVWNLFSGFIIPRPSIPVWWRWYSWANPVAWGLYGLVASQYGDIKQSIESSDGSTTVEGFLRSYFGFKHDFLGVVAAVIVAFPVVFALVFAISVKMFNFQRR